jgi:hypothetical protein
MRQQGLPHRAPQDKLGAHNLLNPQRKLQSHVPEPLCLDRLCLPGFLLDREQFQGERANYFSR